VGVAARAVAGEVDARHLAPVLLRVALGIAVDGAEHTGPRLGDDEIAALVRSERLTLAVADLRNDPGKRQGGGSGLRRHRARERRDHDAAGLRLPPGVDDGTALLADDAVVPHPRLGIDRLADAPEEPERRQVVLARPLLAPFDEGADRGG